MTVDLALALASTMLSSNTSLSKSHTSQLLNDNYYTEIT